MKTGFVKSHFLDSGAFTLWKKSIDYSKENNCDRWDYYETDEFWKYMNKYVKFIKKYEIAIDLYANLDVIGNPQLTWRNQKYLEKKGISPIPVIHYSTSIKWLKKYMEAGYEIIGLGGMAKSIHSTGTIPWLDNYFDIVCDSPDRLPKVKIHGFGVSSIKLWLRYPWWSVDSTSIHKKSAYGWILVPYYRKGKFLFNIPPLHISVSKESPLTQDKGRHLFTLTPIEKEITLKWLNHINIPMGNKKNEKGVINDGTMRKLALYYYYEKMAASVPKYPWPFRKKKETLL